MSFTFAPITFGGLPYLHSDQTRTSYLWSEEKKDFVALQLPFLDSTISVRSTREELIFDVKRFRDVDTTQHRYHVKSGKWVLDVPSPEGDETRQEAPPSLPEDHEPRGDSRRPLMLWTGLEWLQFKGTRIHTFEPRSKSWTNRLSGIELPQALREQPLHWTGMEVLGWDDAGDTGYLLYL